MNGISLLDGTLSSGMQIQAGFGFDGSIGIAIGDALPGLVGDGTFGAHTTYSFTGAGNIRTGDINADGREDLVVLASSQPHILLGNGDGTFQAPLSYSSGTAESNLTLADVNGDGSSDILTSLGNRVSVRLNNGNGTFAASVSYAGPPTGLVINTGDFNEDGRVDMLVGDNSGGSSAPSLLLGNGDGTFKAQTTFPLPTGFAGVNVASDFNQDGNLDFYLVDAVTSQLSVFLGNGDGSFKARQTYSGAGTSTAIYADVNGDGTGDHIAVNFSSTSLSVLFGNADGSFRASTTYHSGAQPLLINSSDLNGDGFADLVASNSGSSTASVLINNGDGTFKAPTTYANASRVRLSDFNGDGVTDMVTTSTNTLGIYLGNTQKTAVTSPVDLTTQEGARTALTTLEGTHTRILSEVGRIGAFRQRLTTAARNLETARENFAAAESRIKDADIAHESAALLKNQITQRVAAAIAAQANRAPEMVLSLLN